MKQKEDDKTIDMFDYMMEEKGREYQSNLDHLLELAMCKQIQETNDAEVPSRSRSIRSNKF